MGRTPREVRNPWDGSIVGEIAEATADDVTVAVKAASQAIAAPLTTVRLVEAFEQSGLPAG